MSSTLTFLGATRTVTGSKFLVETDGTRVMLDCGLFQGDAALRRLNWAPPPVDPTTLDAVVVSHAHLDHSGHLPLLARHGYRGPVLCTPNTARLVPIVLRDAAYLQEEEARHANERGWSKHRPALPLFGQDDAERAIELLTPMDPGADHHLAPEVTVTLRPAGHILGSAFVELRTPDARVLLSGDLGRPDHPLLRPPARPPDADVVLLESTYGSRSHGTVDRTVLAGAVRRTVERGGVVLVPAFALDRTPMLLSHLADLEEAGDIPRLPVFVDSPMALDALEVYESAVRHGDSELRPELLGRGSLRRPRHTTFVRDVDRSRTLNQPDRPCIVVSASGMAVGGRVVHHLRHQLPNPRNTVVLTGFQVPGTRGRALADGAQHLKIQGVQVPVRAEVVDVGGFSAHADADEVLAWTAPMAPPRVAYLVHGEVDAATTLAGRLRREHGWNAVVPEPGDRVTLA